MTDIEKYQAVCAMAYQLAGAAGASKKVLDCLANAAAGVFDIDPLDCLPITLEAQAARLTDAEFDLLAMRNGLNMQTYPSIPKAVFLGVFRAIEGEVRKRAAAPQPAAPSAEPVELVEAVTKAILFEDCGSTADWRDNTDLGKAAIRAYATAVRAAIAPYRAKQVALMQEADKDGRVFNGQGHSQAIQAIDFCLASLATPVAAQAQPDYPGATVADRLDAMADDCAPGSQRAADLRAAATVWRKHLAGPAAQSKRRPYNASGSLSEYGVFPECDAQQPADDEVVFIDGVGAGRSSIKSCRDGVQWIMVGDRVYWPLSDSDAKRLQSACCGNGSFDGPASPAGEGDESMTEQQPVAQCTNETALALADAPRSLRNYVAALQAENERLLAERDALAAALAQGQGEKNGNV